MKKMAYQVYRLPQSLFCLFLFLFLSQNLRASDQLDFVPEEKLVEIYGDLEEKIQDSLNADGDPDFDDTALRSYIRSVDSEINRRDKLSEGPLEQEANRNIAKLVTLKLALEKAKKLKLSTEIKEGVESSLKEEADWVASESDEKTLTKDLYVRGLKIVLTAKNSDDPSEKKISMKTTLHDSKAFLKYLGADDQESELAKHLLKTEIDSASQTEVLADLADVLTPKESLLETDFSVQEKSGGVVNDGAPYQFVQIEEEASQKVSAALNEQFVAETELNVMDAKLSALGDEADENSDIGDAVHDAENVAMKDQEVLEKLVSLRDIAKDLKESPLSFKNKSELCAQITDNVERLTLLSKDFRDKRSLCKEAVVAQRKARNLSDDGKEDFAGKNADEHERAMLANIRSSQKNEEGAEEEENESEEQRESSSEAEKQLAAENQALRQQVAQGARAMNAAQLQATCNQMMMLSPAAFGASKAFVKSLEAIKDKISDISLGKNMDLLASKAFDLTGDEDTGETPEQRTDRLLVDEFKLADALSSKDLSKIGSTYGTAKEELTQLKAKVEKAKDDMENQKLAANRAEVKIAKKEKLIRDAEEKIVDQAYELAKNQSEALTQDDILMAQSILADAGNLQPMDYQVLVEAYRYSLRQRARIDSRIAEVQNDRLWLNQYRMSAQKLQETFSTSLANVRTRLGGVVANVTSAVRGSNQNGGGAAQPVNVIGNGLNKRGTASSTRRQRAI